MASRRNPRSRGRSAGREGPETARESEARQSSRKVTVGILAASAVLVLFFALVSAWPTSQDFLDFGAGVLALVSLSSAVLWGLASTDRVFLYPEHRLVTQSVHRVLAVAGLGFLALHVWIKVVRGRVPLSSAIVPFADPTRPFLIGLGTLAGYGFVGVVMTGVARTAFVSPKRSHLWRVVHMSAYVAWAAALLHGLKSGREAAGWVTQAYAACVAVVAVTLLVRTVKEKDLDRTSPKATGFPPRGMAPPPPPPPPPPADRRNTAPESGAAQQPTGQRLTFDRPVR